MAATHAAKEALWLDKLLTDILPNLIHQLTVLHCNNQSAIKLATDNNYHTCTKHLDQHFHFIHNLNAQSVIKLSYCPTDNMVTNILTKALSKWKVVAHSASLSLRHACGAVLK